MVADGRFARLLSGRRGALATGLAFGVAYYIAASVGLWFRVPETGIAAFWPAAGLSFAALYLSPRSRWAALLAGLVVADLAKNAVAGFGPATSVLITIGNAVEPLLANLILGGGRDECDPVLTPRSTTRLVLAALAATSVSGVIGAAGVALGTPAEWSAVYASWVIGDLTAVLSVGSVAVAWAARDPDDPRADRRTEALVIITVLTAVTAVVFWGSTPATAQPYVMLLFVAWVGLRSTPVVARTAALWIVLLGGLATVQGDGHFATGHGTGVGQWLAFQVWGMVIVVAALAVTVETDRRRVAEQQLARSESRFRSIADSAPVGIFRTSAAGTHEYGNPALHAILGLDDARLAEEGWQHRVHADDREQAAADFRRAIETGRPASTDLRMTAPDGTLRWLTGSVVPHTGPDGTIAGMVGTLIDRTEEHRADERRRAEQERFLLAFTYSASPMWVTGLTGDEFGRTVEANDAMAEMLGLRREDMVGRPSAEFVAEEDRDLVSARVRRAVDDPTVSISDDVRMRRADGSTFWANYLIGVARDADGRPRYVVGHLRDIDEARTARRHLTRMATTDPLTGVANRNLLLERLSEGIEEAHRTGSGLAVLFLDLDRFKLINDSLGHRIGDELLRAVSRRLQEHLRDGDTLARLGGDEFVVLCPTVAGPEQAETIAARLRGCFADPFDAVGHRLHVGASIGISMLGPDHTDPATLIEAADTALYRAKENGRNRIQLYTEDLRRQAEAQLRTEEFIRWALDDDRLRLELQPIIGMGDGRVWGHEALVRIEDTDGQLVLPGRWLATAEASGLIAPVGEWVLQRALHLLSELDDDSVMCVNVSGHQLLDADLIRIIEEHLDRCAIATDRLVLEMTESVLIETHQAFRAGLDRIRHRGVRIAIDDFGTGYSSLSYLKELPADLVKIDRSFVSGLGHDTGDRAIATAIVRLAQELGLGTVAEGIETVEQLDAVRALGCTFGQGFLLGRPAPAPVMRVGTPPS